MKKVFKKLGLTVCSFVLVLSLSSCGAAQPQVTESSESEVISSETAVTESIQPEVTEKSESTEAATEASVTEDTQPTEHTNEDTAAPDSMQEISYSEELETVVFPDVDITDPQISDPMLFGEKYGNWISRRVWAYFGYSGFGKWIMNYSDQFFDDEYEHCYSLCVGQRFNKDDPTSDKGGVPISYASGRKYITEKLHLTDRCFDILCEGAPSSYCEKDGKLYFSEGFGGQAGWDDSIIVDYEAGEDSITYNCLRLAWEGNDDKPFTITFKYVDGRWLLDDCTYVEGFGNYFCCTEPIEDEEAYYEYYNI